MRSSIISAAAFLAAAAPVAQASKAYVHNKCDFPVHVWSVDTDKAPGDSTQIESGGDYNEECRSPEAGGVSIKINKEDQLAGQIAQFEYTVGGEMAGHLWYDLSFVDCQNDDCPWMKYPMYMNSGEGCPEVKCAAHEVCAGAYNKWNDDWASRSCPEGADIHLYLCADSANGGGEQKPIQSPSDVPTPSAGEPLAFESVPAQTFQPAVKAAEAQGNNVAPSPAPTPAPEHVETVVTTVTETSTTTEEYQFPARHAARHVHHRRGGH